VEECAFRGIQVFSDEVYDHMILDDEEYSSVLSCGTDLDHLIMHIQFLQDLQHGGTARGLGYLQPGRDQKLRRYHMFTTSVANTPAQFGGVAALEGDQQSVRDMIDIYRERRDLIVDLVNQTPHLTGYKPGGGFFIFPDLPDHVDAADVCLRMLKETGVCAVPGDAFGEHCTNSIRFSFSHRVSGLRKPLTASSPG